MIFFFNVYVVICINRFPCLHEMNINLIEVYYYLLIHCWIHFA